MIKQIKRLIFKSLSLEQYLRILQRNYFFAYNTGLLKLSRNYDYHYFVKHLISEGDVVIDIGANLGYYSILFGKWVGKKGQVYSVEPIKIYNQIFQEKAKKYPQIELYPYALGLEEKEVELVSSPHTGYLRTGLPHVYDESKDGNLDNQEFKFKAQMKRASLLFGNLDRVDYIKCDIEGFELLVLKDMKEIIRKHKPTIQVEVWPENEKELLDMFIELGYETFKLNRHVLEPYKPQRNIQGDFIFIPKQEKV